MARQWRGRTRAVSVRMPEEVWKELVAVATARGQDMTAVVNGIIAEARPALRRWLSEHAPDARPAPA